MSNLIKQHLESFPLEKHGDAREQKECSNRAAGKLADCARLLKTRRGEVAERLKAAVC